METREGFFIAARWYSKGSTYISSAIKIVLLTVISMSSRQAETNEYREAYHSVLNYVAIILLSGRP